MDSWAKRGTRKTDAPSGAWLLHALLLVLPPLSCAGKPAPDAAGIIGVTGVAEARPTDHAVDFNFDSLDDRPVSSQAFRGKPAVVAFVASDDLSSQAQADFLAAMFKRDGDRVMYALIAMEGPERRELVEGFRQFFANKFGVSFRMAMADKDTLAGQGPFGDVRGLTVVVLDREGKIVWQRVGLSKTEEIRAGMRGLAP